MKGQLATVILVVVAGVVVRHLGWLFYDLRSYGNDVFNHRPGACKRVEGFVTDGSEDMTQLPSGQIIITSGLRRFSKIPDKVSRGALYLLDPSKSVEKVEKLKLVGLEEQEPFSPHGLHHWVHGNGSVSVFVVTHEPEFVMRFLYDGETTLTRTKVYHNLSFMRNMNGIMVTGEDSFYFTNFISVQYDHDVSLRIWLEVFLGRASGSIVHVQGDAYTFVSNHLPGSNGITGDDRFVYTACEGGIYIFSRQPDNSLRLHKTIAISIGNLDNLQLDSDGSLWVGCQLLRYALVDHMFDNRIACPSEVLRIRDPIGEGRIESVFKDDGKFLSCSSVGLYNRNSSRLFIGSVCAGMAVCDVAYLMED